MLNSFKKFLPGGRDQYQHTLLGESLEDVCKQATDKQLDVPDEDAMNQIVDIINDQDGASGGYSSKDVAQILRTRLKQDNPHKQWLAVVLTRRVLRDCAVKMRVYEGELLHDVAKIAARPSRRGSQDIQRRARQEAMALLREYGERGQVALRAAAGLQPQQPPPNLTPVPTPTPTQGYVDPAQYYVQQQYDPSQFQQQQVQPSGNVLDEVHGLIEVAAGHAELLEEMVLAMASEEGDDFGANLCGDLVTEIHALKQKFPGALERLSTETSPEAETLMKAALEASDSLDNVLSLYESVYLAQQQQQQQQQPQNNNNSVSTDSTPVPTSHPTPAIATQPTPNLMDNQPPPTSYVPLHPPPSSAVPVTSQVSSQQSTNQPQPKPYQPTADDPFGLDELSAGLQVQEGQQQQQQQIPVQQNAVSDPFAASVAPMPSPVVGQQQPVNPFTGSAAAVAEKSPEQQQQQTTNVEQEWNMYFPDGTTSPGQGQQQGKEGDTI